MRRQFANARRFSSPVNYQFWNQISDVTAVSAIDKWYLFDVNSNDSPNAFPVAYLIPPDHGAYEYQSATGTPEVMGVPTGDNIKPLWTTGKVHVNCRSTSTALCRLELYRLLPKYSDVGVPSAVPAANFAEAKYWMWQNSFTREAQLGAKVPQSRYTPLWRREWLHVPFSVSGSGTSAHAARTFPLKYRHQTGQALNSATEQYVLFYGARSVSGSVIEDGTDIMAQIKTSYIR